MLLLRASLKGWPIGKSLCGREMSLQSAVWAVPTDDPGAGGQKNSSNSNSEAVGREGGKENYGAQNLGDEAVLADEKVRVLVLNLGSLRGGQ